MSKYLDLDGLEYYTNKLKEEMNKLIIKPVINMSFSLTGWDDDGKPIYSLNIIGDSYDVIENMVYEYINTGETIDVDIDITTPNKYYWKQKMAILEKKTDIFHFNDGGYLLSLEFYIRGYYNINSGMTDFHISYTVEFDDSLEEITSETKEVEEVPVSLDYSQIANETYATRYGSALIADTISYSDYPDLYEGAFVGKGTLENVITGKGLLTGNDVINNVTSTTTNKPLSANMGKELQDQIDNLKSRGRFLSLWNATTGLATTTPTENPYTYKTGDYFIVGVVGSTNYKPTGSTYNTSSPSRTVETNAVSVDDVYYYDGTKWDLQINTQKTVSFSNLAGNPTDNTNLASALNAKQDTITVGSEGLTKTGNKITANYCAYEGSTATPGIIKVTPSNNCEMSDTHFLRAMVRTANEMKQTGVNDTAFVGKGTLNNVLNDRFANLTLSKLTQAQYNALSTKDANTMYIIVG